MKASGKIIKCTEAAPFNGRTGVSTSETTFRIKRVATASSCGPMVVLTRESGSAENSTEKECTSLHKVSRSMEAGKTADGTDGSDSTVMNEQKNEQNEEN